MHYPQCSEMGAWNRDGKQVYGIESRNGDPKQRKNIHWRDINEENSTHGAPNGNVAKRPKDQKSDIYR